MEVEITGTLEIGRWGDLADGTYTGLLTPTNRSRRFRIVVKPKPPKTTGKVRVRYHGRKLTEGPESGKQVDSAVEKPGIS